MSQFDNIPTSPEPGDRRSGFFSAYRLRLAVFLITAIVTFVLLFGGHEQATPQDLYHTTWQTVPAYIFDQGSLKDWNSWEHKFDSRIKTEADAVKYANVMLASLNDQYTMLLDKQQTAAENQEEQGNFVGVGLSLGARLNASGNIIPAPDGSPMPAADGQGYPVIIGVIAGGPAEKAGLAAHTTITSIDGQDVRGQSLKQLTALLHGSENSSVTLGVNNGGRNSSVTLTRQAIATNPVTIKTLPGGITYIRLDNFDQKNADDLSREALAANSNATAYIVDLRDNPGGIGGIAFDIASLFLDQGTVATFKMRVPNGGYDTETVKLTPDAMLSEVTHTGSSKPVVETYARKPNLTANKPVVILVNGNTASAAELFTGALKDNGRAVVLGTRTFGKGIGQGVVDFPDSTRLHITVGRYYTPSGAWLGDGGNSVKQGIEPNIKVPDPDASSATGVDTQLQAAIDYLTSLQSGN